MLACKEPFLKCECVTRPTCSSDIGLCVFLGIHVQNQGFEACVTAQVTITSHCVFKEQP